MCDKYPKQKSDRFCNNPDCRKRLTEDAPNWFQCSYECMKIVWELNNPKKEDENFS